MNQKFEIKLTKSKKKFAEECQEALKTGDPVSYKRRKHLVYHFADAGEKGYVVGLVLCEGENETGEIQEEEEEVEEDFPF